jgi:probable F420-dependent oxidoreductase
MLSERVHAPVAFGTMRFGVALGRMHPSMFTTAATAADALGFESVWLPEHLVLPIEMTSSPFPGEDHPPVPPSTPVFDSMAYLAFIAGRTSRIRLATHVYNLALRHPFVAARAVQTVDVVSEGRFELGVGAGWLASEWRACGMDFATRGKRLDEALEVCKKLWTDDVVEHHGEFFDFDPVRFDPKPLQKPHPPVLIGGESAAALRRAAHHDGWVGLEHTPESAAKSLETIRRLRADLGLDGEPFSVTIGAAQATAEDIDAFEAVGVDRMLVSPWQRTREVPDGLARFAERFLG